MKNTHFTSYMTQLWFLYALLHVYTQPFTHHANPKSLKGTLGCEFDNLAEIKDIETTVLRKAPNLKSIDHRPLYADALHENQRFR